MPSILDLLKSKNKNKKQSNGLENVLCNRYASAYILEYAYVHPTIPLTDK